MVTEMINYYQLAPHYTPLQPAYSRQVLPLASGGTTCPASVTFKDAPLIKSSVSSCCSADRWKSVYTSATLLH